MVAEVAFLSDRLFIIKGNRIIRAFRNTGLTTGTLIVDHDDNPVLPFDDGHLRTGVGTGRVVAVPAQINPKNKFRPAITHFGSVLTDGDQSDAVRRPIFLLAGHLTGAAAPTEIIIYAE
jgi:hypothetical protein